MSAKTKLGLCVVCGSRVHQADNHLKTMDGYCHRNCIANTNAVKA